MRAHTAERQNDTECYHQRHGDPKHGVGAENGDENTGGNNGESDDLAVQPRRVARKDKTRRDCADADGSGQRGKARSTAFEYRIGKCRHHFERAATENRSDSDNNEQAANGLVCYHVAHTVQKFSPDVTLLLEPRRRRT